MPDDAGARDQDVKLPVVFLGDADGSIHVLQAADISGYGLQRFACSEPSFCRGKQFGVEIEENDAGAVLEELPGDRHRDVPAAAGDQRYLVLESH